MNTGKNIKDQDNSGSVGGVFDDNDDDDEDNDDDYHDECMLTVVLVVRFVMMQWGCW